MGRAAGGADTNMKTVRDGFEGSNAENTFPFSLNNMSGGGRGWVPGIKAAGGLVSPLNKMAGLAFIMEGLLCIGGRCACR